MKKQKIVTYKKIVMKTDIKLYLILTLLLVGNIKGQVSDTLAYIKSFEFNKNEYKGHPFSKLLNEMSQLQPSSIWSDETLINTYRSTLVFCKMDDVPSIGMVNMVIFWQSPIPYSDVEYYEQKNHFYFTTDERNFYGNKIVKDIYVYTTK